MTERHPMTAQDLWKLRRVGLPSPAASGAFVVVGVTTYDVEENKGKEQLHLLPSDGGPARALTSPEVSSSEPAVSPDGRRLAFVRKPVGQERPQLFVMPLDGGEARKLSDLPLGASDPRWFPDGKRIAVISALYREALSVDGTRKLAEERAKQPVRPHITEDRVFRFWDHWLSDGEVHHVFAVDAESGETRDLTPDSEHWFDLMDPSGQIDISPDGEELAFSANTTSAPYTRVRWGIYTTPVAAVGAAPVVGGPIRCLTPDNPGDDIRPRYSPDGRFLVYGSKKEWDNYADRVRLTCLDRQSGVQTTLSEGWDRSAVAWEFVSARALVVEAEDEARAPLFAVTLVESEGGPRIEAPRLIVRDGALHGARPAADGYIYAQQNSIRHPPEVVRVRFAGGHLEPLASFNAELMATMEMGEVEEIHYRGAGGAAAHMMVVYPPGFDKSKKWPLVHQIHGGPYGVQGDSWHFRWNPQVFAAPGYVVAMVNFHGSSSFGQGYSDSILGNWGGEAAQDIFIATDLLLERGYIDPARMAIAGGSFGGYMTCWLATQSDRFACAIAHASVYDLGAMTASDVVQGSEREVGGEAWNLPATREGLDRWNPAANTGNYKTPMLIIHGEKDYRCPVNHGLELYGTLKSRGVPARLVYFPDEGHWILKPRNSLVWFREFLGWLARYLG